MLLQELIFKTLPKNIKDMQKRRSQLRNTADNYAYPVDIFRRYRNHPSFRIVAGKDGHLSLTAQTFADYIAVGSKAGDHDFVGRDTFE